MFTFRMIHYACACYWQAETKQTFFPTASLIRAMASVFPDPYTLVENSKDNMKLLPDITWVDIYNYPINAPDLYTSQSLKVYKSL